MIRKRSTTWLLAAYNSRKRLGPRGSVCEFLTFQQVGVEMMATLAIRRLGIFAAFLLTAVMLVPSYVLQAADVRAEQRLVRPNIVFAFADDLGRYASAYGKLEPGGANDVVRTPVFDIVAQEGVLFRNAFVNAPSCTPCRSSLLSGQYFFRTGRGAILQGAIWDDSIPTFPLLLEKSNYHIGHSYKVWSPGTPANAPIGAGRTAFNKQGNKFNGFSQFVSNSTTPDDAKQTLYKEARANFTDFLAARQGSEPFCYWFGPTNCHRKWTKGSGKKLWGIDPDALKGKLPPFLPDNDVVREDFADYLGEVQAFDAGVGQLIDVLKEAGELERTIFVISGDHGIPGFPRGKCNLYDFGVMVPLAIRWGSEISGGPVARGRVVDDFVNLPDLAPTILEAAGVPIPETMTGRSLVSVMRSGKAAQVDPTRDAVVVGRERHVAQARTDSLPYPQRAIRTKEFLYIRNFKPDRWPMGVGPGYGLERTEMPKFEALENDTFAAFGDLDASPTKAWIATHKNDPGIDVYFDFAFGLRPAEELYDLANDPHQIKNVANEAKFSDAKKMLSERLMRVLTENGDPRVTGDGSSFDKPPFAGEPTQAGKAKKK